MNSQAYKNELKMLLINGSAILGAYVLKRVTEKILESTTEIKDKKKPQGNEEFSWIEAMGWAAFAGSMASTLKLLISRGARVQFDKFIQQPT